MITNILVTNFNGEGEDVLIMTEQPLCSLSVAFALAHKGQTFDEVFPIKEEERQYYCFDPLWMSDSTVENTKKLADDFKTANPKGSARYEEVKRKCGL